MDKEFAISIDGPVPGLYVAGLLTPEEAQAVEKQAASDLELAATIKLMRSTLGHQLSR